MSEMRELMTGTKEDATIKPTATSNTLSLKKKSVNPAHISRIPRLTVEDISTLIKAVDSFNNQERSFDIWEVAWCKVYCELRKKQQKYTEEVERDGLSLLRFSSGKSS